MRSITAFRFTTLCLLFGTFAKTSAAQYEVDGQIEQTLYKTDGSVQLAEKSAFKVFVSDASWLIQTTNLDADGNPLTVVETGSTNGGVIYSVVAPIDKNAPMAGRFGGRRVPNLNSAFVYSNDVPVGETDDDYMGHLWLMFASGRHLTNLSTNWLTPVYDLNASASVDSTLKRRAEWKLANAHGSLPSDVTFYLNSTDAAIDATYAAAGVTNAGELIIPNGFIFEQRVGARFAPGTAKPGDATPAYRIRKRAIATVTAVRPYCSRVDFIPRAEGTTQVTDERLARMPNSNPRMFYRFPDGVRWVSVGEARKWAAAQTPLKNPPSRAIVVVILLAPLAVVICLWLLNRSKGQTVIHPNDS